MRARWILVVIAGGAAVALQSRVNGALTVRIGDGVTAALISFSLGLAIAAAAAALTPAGRAGTRRMLAALRDGRLSWWYAMTGVFGAAFVTTQSIAVPLVGVALFTAGNVAGQTLSGILVDRIGVGVLGASPISPRRVLGALVVCAAVAIGAVGSGAATTHVLAVLLPVVAGALVSVQQAFGGQVQHHSASTIAQTLSNFVVGTIVLAIVVLVRAALGTRASIADIDWWMLAGGPLGVAFIAIGAAAVQRIGVLALGLGLIAGQVVTALVLDLVVPAAAHAVTVWSFVTAGLVIVGVAIATVRRRARPTSPLR